MPQPDEPEEAAGEPVRGSGLVLGVVAVLVPGLIEEIDEALVENIKKVPQGLVFVLMLGHMLGEVGGQGRSRAVQAHEIEHHLRRGRPVFPFPCFQG